MGHQVGVAIPKDATSALMWSFFNFGEDIMLMQGDFDLNSVQICTQSLEEALKQTMLNQEVIFRNQVCGHHHYTGWVMHYLSCDESSFDIIMTPLSDSIWFGLVLGQTLHLVVISSNCMDVTCSLTA